MNDRTLRHSLCATFALALVTGTAGAQRSTNSAGAEALYEEARALMKQGDFAHACPKFKHSYELDPGGGTLLNLAECYEKQGRFASAWSSFKEALVIAQRDGRSERVDYAKKHLAVVEPKLSRITIQVADGANEPGLSITLDDAELGDAAWGVGMPVDPGTHRVVATAPNRVRFERSIEISSASATIEVPKLTAETKANAEPRLIDTDTEKRPVADETSGSGRRTAGYAIGGAGILALGVGGYFGLHAMSKWSERKDNCAGGCTSAAKSAGDDAKSAAIVSDVGIGLGLVAIGVGTYLVLSSKSAPETSAVRGHSRRQARAVQVLPALEPTGGGLVIRGTY